MKSRTGKPADAVSVVQNLAFSEERFRDFAEAASDWFFELDKELKYSFVSERYREVSGNLPEAVIGKTQWQVDEKSRLPIEEANRDAHVATMKAHQSWRDYTYTLIRDDGEHRLVSTSAKAIFDKEGKFSGYRGVGSDITGRENSKARLDSLLDVVPDAIVSISENGIIASFNRAAESLFGYIEAEVVGRNIKLLMPSPYHDEHDNYLRRYKATGEKKIIGIGREVEAQRKDGTVFPINLAVNEMLIEGKRMFTGVIHDVSALKQAQMLGDRLGRILDQSLNEIYVFDAETLLFVQVNYGGRNNTGYSIEELQKLTPVDLKLEMSLEQFEALVLPLRDKTKGLLVFQTQHQRKDGSIYPVEIHLQLMSSEAQPVFVAIGQDTTERQMQSETLLLRDRAMAEIDVGVLIVDASKGDNPIVYANHALERITGYSTEEMMGRNPRFLHGEESDQPELDKIRFAISNAEPVHVTLRNYRKDGTRFMNEMTISPVHNDVGKVTHFIGIQRDVTAKIETEDRLRHSQKLEAIGQLTGGIAHDFNNLLTVIIGNNELLASKLNGDKELLSLLDDASGAAESGAKLTGQLLAYARQQSLSPQTIDLNELIRNMTEMLKRTLGETVELSTKLFPDLDKTHADPGQVHNALLNLAINARDAMPDGGKLVIETSNVELDEEAASLRIEVSPGSYVRLSVWDTGTGMSKEVQARVFEPFFTTKEQGKGTGLGLSMVHGFAKQSGGHLDVYSELDHGTSVSMYLPSANDKDDASAVEYAHTAPMDAGGELVLVVEDDPRVRKITVKRLESLGYKILEAETGQEALDVLVNSPTVDIVFTDMVMPGGMTGAELAEKIRNKYPDVKLLLTSGYAEDRTAITDGTPWLRKPYPLEQMARTFRELLD